MAPPFLRCGNLNVRCVDFFQLPHSRDSFDAQAHLGDGSEGSVWLASSRHLGPVAVKVGSAAKISCEGLRRVPSHASIVQIFDLQHEGATAYVTMELGQSDLQQSLRRSSDGRLSETTAARYFTQLVSGLKFCHDQGLYHCDIKPENVTLHPTSSDSVSNGGRGSNGELAAKLADFGSAVSMVAPRMATSSSGSTVPRDNTEPPTRRSRSLSSRRRSPRSSASASLRVCVCVRCLRGSRTYQAPELWQQRHVHPCSAPADDVSSSSSDGNFLEDDDEEQPVDEVTAAMPASVPVDLAAADVWSLGVTLFVMCAGRSPWDERGQSSEVELRFPAHFSAPLRDILSAMLRIQPCERISLEAARRHEWVQTCASSATAALAVAAVRRRRLSPASAAFSASSKVHRADEDPIVAAMASTSLQDMVVKAMPVVQPRVPPRVPTDAPAMPNVSTKRARSLSSGSPTSAATTCFPEDSATKSPRPWSRMRHAQSAPSLLQPGALQL